LPPDCRLDAKTDKGFISFETLKNITKSNVLHVRMGLTCRNNTVTCDPSARYQWQEFTPDGVDLSLICSSNNTYTGIMTNPG
jgi:hypothetical protein